MKFFSVIFCLLLSPGLVLAEAGDWLVRVGAHTVDPKSDNSDIVEVDAGTMATFNVTYFVNTHWAVELLAALPFEHDVNLVNGPEVAQVKHLPPTLSAQYHFRPGHSLRPYLGVGVNYTLFFQEDTRGPLDGTRLELEDSVGLAAQIGVDLDISDKWFVNAEVRWIDIGPKAKVDGTSLGRVEIDPFVYGINLGFRI